MKRQLSYGNLSLLVRDSSFENNLLTKKQSMALLERTLPIFEWFLKKNGVFHKNNRQIEFSLSFCGNFKIRRLNKTYRKKDKITDVLSFPLHENLSLIKSPPPVLHLGDVFICRQKALRQSRQFGRTLNDEYLHLLIHGFLHLMGMDHEESIHAATYMESWEKKLKFRILN